MSPDWNIPSKLTRSIDEHSFVIVEEGDGGSDLWEVEEDLNKTEDKVVIKIDEETQSTLDMGEEKKDSAEDQG